MSALKLFTKNNLKGQSNAVRFQEIVMMSIFNPK